MGNETAEECVHIESQQHSNGEEKNGHQNKSEGRFRCEQARWRSESAAQQKGMM